MTRLQLNWSITVLREHARVGPLNLERGSCISIHCTILACTQSSYTRQLVVNDYFCVRRRPFKFKHGDSLIQCIRLTFKLRLRVSRVFIHSLHENRVAVSLLSSSQFVCL